jgi:hypothetical protein
MSVLAFLLLFSVSFPAVSGYRMGVSVDDTGTSSVTSEIDFFDSADKAVSFCFSGNFYNAEVHDRSGLPMESDFDFEGDFTCIYFVPEDYARIYFESHEFTSKNASLWDFDMKMYSSEQVDSFSSSLLLPPGSVLTKTNGAVESSGNSTQVSWTLENVTSMRRFNMTAGYRIVPSHDLGGIFLFIVFMAIAVVSYLSYRRGSSP